MSSRKIKTKENLTLPLALSITGGIFMILGGITLTLMTTWIQSMPLSQFMRDAMMSTIWNLVMPRSFDPMLIAVFSGVSIGTGTAVLVGSYKIYTDPKGERVWAFVVLISSIVGLFCASGFGIGGAALGILGGIGTLLSKKARYR